MRHLTVQTTAGLVVEERGVRVVVERVEDEGVEEAESVVVSISR